MRKQLTEAMIEKIASPASGRTEIFDAIIPGLALRVTSTGAKTFVVRGRIRGQAAPVRITIGDATAVKVSDAREQASELLKLCRAGKDPRIIRKAEKAATVKNEALRWENVVATFIDKHAKKNRSWKHTEALFAQRVTPVWKGRQLGEITRADVVTLLDTIEEDSIYRANATLAAVRKLFNWAVLRGLVQSTPIVPGMARQGVISRDRFLTFEEIRVIWRAADRIGAPFGPMVKFLLVTGQRRGEVAGARWTALDLDQERLWTLTPEDTKAARGHLVPLTDLALGIIRDQPKIAPPSVEGKPAPEAVFVFTTTGTTPISGFGKAKRTLDAEITKALVEEAAERGVNDPDRVKPMPAWRLHDLRRTVATHMEDALGIPPHVVGSVLNHAPAGYKGVTSVYTRGDLIYARRRALVAWARLLQLVLDGGPIWTAVAQILRPETEAQAALTDEFRRMVQGDESAWVRYLAGVGGPAVEVAA